MDGWSFLDFCIHKWAVTEKIDCLLDGWLPAQTVRCRALFLHEPVSNSNMRSYWCTMIDQSQNPDGCCSTIDNLIEGRDCTRPVSPTEASEPVLRLNFALVGANAQFR